MNQDLEFKAREVCMTSLSHNSIQIDNKAYTVCQKAIDVTTTKKVSFNLW